MYGPYMDDKRLELRVSEELLAHIDRARGELARSAFVKAAVRRHVAMLSSPDVAKMTRVVAEAVPPGSGPPPRVYPPPTAREVEATRNIAEQTGKPEPVPGCPECGGELQLVEDRFSVGDGQSLVCEDCGWSR